MKKAKPKVRIYHVSFLDKGAEVLVTPASAFVSLFSNGLMVKQGGRQIAYIPNIHSFWELGSIVRQPTELGQSQAEQQQAFNKMATMPEDEIHRRNRLILEQNLKALAAKGAATHTNSLPPDLGGMVGITYPVK